MQECELSVQGEGVWLIPESEGCLRVHLEAGVLRLNLQGMAEESGNQILGGCHRDRKWHGGCQGLRREG